MDAFEWAYSLSKPFSVGVFTMGLSFGDWANYYRTACVAVFV